MPIKFTEQVERWCCQPQDLRTVRDSPLAYPHARHPKFKDCQICGQRFKYTTFMDAAGSSDWDYRPTKERV